METTTTTTGRIDPFAELHPDEAWRAIPLPPGHAAYEASTYGRIRRADTRRPVAQRPTWHRRRHMVPYMKVDLWRTPQHPAWAKRHSSTANVHVLVCLAFHGPRPHGYDVDHEDKDCHNNTPQNLRWRPMLANRADHRPRGSGCKRSVAA